MTDRPASKCVSAGGSWVVSAAVLSDMNEFDQRVSIGDSLTLPEFGKSYRIPGINPSVTEVVTIGGVQVPPSALRELGLMNTPDFSAAGTEHPQSASAMNAVSRPGGLTTYKFGFQRSPQPLLGEPSLQLTGGTAIDYRAGPYKTSFGGAAGPYNPPTTFGVTAVTDTASVGGLTFDIIFAPSGQVLNNNAGLICLWVRDTSKGVANPLAVIMSGVMMLNHIHEEAIGRKIKHAYDAILLEGKTLTRDLGGTASTNEFTDALIAKLPG